MVVSADYCSTLHEGLLAMQGLQPGNVTTVDAVESGQKDIDMTPPVLDSQVSNIIETA